jgi:hypothetical protein
LPQGLPAFRITFLLPILPGLPSRDNETFPNADWLRTPRESLQHACLQGLLKHRKPPMTQLDIPLDEMVFTALEQNPHLARRNLRFESEQGRITLLGTVNSYYQKQMAQEALREIVGIAEIINELNVAMPQSEPVTLV